MEDHIHDVVKVFVDVLISDTQNAPAVPVEIRITSAVMRQFFVRTVCRAIHLDYQMRRDAGKIGNIGADWVLTTKPHAANRVVSKA